MNKDIQPNESDSFHSSQVKLASITDVSPLNSSIIEQYSNPLQLSLSSPLKKRSDDIIEEHQMKNYPSKMNVCKGLSSNNIIPFSANSSSSPIVQYYAGIIQSPDKNKTGHYSPEVQYPKNEKPVLNQTSYFHQSLPHQNYDYSPGTIFNNISQKRSSNSSMMAKSNSSSTHSPVQAPFMSKSLQEKIEGNFKKSQLQYESETIKLKSDNQSNSNSEDIDKDSSDEENPDLYMLSFNSDEDVTSDNKDKIGKETNANHHNHHQDPHQYLKEIRERETKEKSNKQIIVNKFDEVNANLSHKHKHHHKPLETKPIDAINSYYQDPNREYYHLSTDGKPQLAYYDYNSLINEDLSNVPSYLEYQIMASQNNQRIARLDPISYVDQPYDVLAQNLYLLTKDQGGCRYLQKLLELDSINVINAIYPPLIEFIVEVVVDPFGNYLIQKLLNYLNQNQLQEVITILSPHIFDIGANSHGTRVIQQLINHLTTPSLISTFFKMIMSFIIPLLNELNGTHIIQKFCSIYPNEAFNIYLIIIENCLTLATHRHGCCVLQKYLETLKKDLHKKLLDKLIANCLLLIIDQFGNYVIQSILYLKDIKSSNAITVKLLENVCYYSKHKYSSNVVEKCFDYCDNHTRHKLIEALAKQEVINDLILDEHGNYVVQKVLACIDYRTQTQLLQGIMPLFPRINELSFGEHIISRLMISYPQLRNKSNEADTTSKSNRGGAYSKRGSGYYYNTKQINEDDSNNQNWGKQYNNNGNSCKNYSGGFNSNNNSRYYRGGYNTNQKHQPKYK